MKSTRHMCFLRSAKCGLCLYVLSLHDSQLLQMCEQAAEAHKSKGAIQLSRRSRTSSDPGQLTKSSVDAILSNNGSAATSQVRSCLCLPFFLYRLGFWFTLWNLFLYWAGCCFGRPEVSDFRFLMCLL